MTTKLIGSDCCEFCKHAFTGPGLDGRPEIVCRRNPPSATPLMGMTPKGPVMQGKVSLFPKVEANWRCGVFERDPMKQITAPLDGDLN